MISNATRALCAVLSTAAAAGLVVFANPANAVGTTLRAAPATQMATLAATAGARG